MAATLKSKLNSGREPAPPAYDYEDLETKFDIHKYYPKYFHNYNYSTPVIKDMIADKPIYADANKHNKAWKNPGARQTVSRTIDLDTGNITTKPVGAKEFKRAIKNERKSLHKDHRHEKRELRRDQRHERKAIRKEHHQELPDIERQPKADAEHDDIVLFKSWDNPLAAPQPVRRSDGRYPSDISGSAVLHYNHHKTNEPLRFNDPFDSTASTLVPHESTNSRTKTKTHSIAHTFKNLMKIEHHHEHNNSDSTSSRRSSVTANKLAPSSSYDQTKLSMTTSRTMSLLKKMTGSDRRNSEAPGTYTPYLHANIFSLAQSVRTSKFFFFPICSFFFFSSIHVNTLSGLLKFDALVTSLALINDEIIATETGKLIRRMSHNR